MGRLKGKGKKLECIHCIHCKTRVFRSVDALKKWCGRKAIKPNATWVNEARENGWIRLIWCTEQTSQFCTQGFSPRNASPAHTVDLENKLREEVDKVLVSNFNVNPFIPDCPFKLI